MREMRDGRRRRDLKQEKDSTHIAGFENGGEEERRSSVIGHPYYLYGSHNFPLFIVLC